MHINQKIIEDACGESPAASLDRDFRSILHRKRGLGVSPEGSRGSLGGSWGSPGALLEGSWGVRGRFRSRLFGYEILRRFFDPKREVLGRDFGGISGGKRFKNR